MNVTNEVDQDRQSRAGVRATHRAPNRCTLRAFALAASASRSFGAAFVSSIFAHDIARASTHSGISIYLYAATFVMAGFIARKPGADDAPETITVTTKARTRYGV